MCIVQVVIGSIGITERRQAYPADVGPTQALYTVTSLDLLDKYVTPDASLGS